MNDLNASAAEFHVENNLVEAKLSAAAQEYQPANLQRGERSASGSRGTYTLVRNLNASAREFQPAQLNEEGPSTDNAIPLARREPKRATVAAAPFRQSITAKAFQPADILPSSSNDDTTRKFSAMNIAVHDTVAKSANYNRSDAWESYESPGLELEGTIRTPKRASCRFFLQGACRKGNSCPFVHNTKEFCSIVNEIPPVDSDDTTYDVHGGVFCRFDRGAAVRELILEGKVAPTICVSGISKAITDEEITTKLLQFGTISSIVRKHETYAFVKFENGICAAKAVEQLSGSSLKDWKRVKEGSFRKIPHANTPMLNGSITLNVAVSPGSIVLQESTVKIQWYAPSRIAWANFHSIEFAQKAALLCNDKTLLGRKLSVRFQRPSARQKDSFSISIGGLDPCSSAKQIKTFITKHSGKFPFSLTLMKTQFTDAEAPNIVRRVVETFGPVLTFQNMNTQSDTLKRKALVKFRNAQDAAVACNELNLRGRSELGGNKIFISRLFSGKVSVGNKIYEIIKSDVHDTLKDLHENDQVRHTIHWSPSKVTIALQADEAEAISHARGKMMPISLGYLMMSRHRPLWHSYFARREADASIAQLNSTHRNAYILCNKRQREIRLFGNRERRDALEAAINSLLQTADNTKHAVPLTPNQYAYCLRGGKVLADKIVSATRVNSISLDLSCKSLLVKSDTASAKKIVGFVAKQMAASTDENLNEKSTNLCPVCFCLPGEEDGDNSITLDCKHSYCEECFNSWIERGHRCSFPLKCLADGCNMPLRVGKLRQLLGEDDFLSLLRASVDDYVNANLNKFRFCIFPDCAGIYNLQDQRVEKCSKCLSSICTKCNVEEHFGLTCSQHLMAKLPPNRLRNKVVNEILTLRCPRCEQAFFDFDGCFSIKCNNCPCSFCGWCLEDCGNDAHPHVRKCKFKPKSADSYFGTRKQFEEVHCIRQKRELDKFLGALPATERCTLLASLGDDLGDIGLVL